ncbi:MAG: hypothetical protein IPK82_05080 [Polyangiaceae bacterium]|nr:hypothetical protein [Polyangiaceae bacterium]
MTLPKRWLEDSGDAANAVRDVLRAGRDMDPPEGAERGVWLALSAQIAAGGAGVGSGAGASATTGTTAGTSAVTGTGASTTAAGAASSGLIKAILIGAFGGVIAVTGYSVLEPASPPVVSQGEQQADPKAAHNKPSSVAPVATSKPKTESPKTSEAPVSAGGSAPAPSQSVSAPVGTAPPADSASAQPVFQPSGDSTVGSSSFVPGSPEERASRLREENELVGQARGALRSGDPARAMQILMQAGQKFPDGVLGQEREALMIEALAKSGSREAASVRAAAFIKAHPTSPHSARLQAFVIQH